MTQRWLSQESADTCNFSRRWNFKHDSKMALLKINDRFSVMTEICLRWESVNTWEFVKKMKIQTCPENGSTQNKRSNFLSCQKFGKVEDTPKHALFWEDEISNMPGKWYYQKLMIELSTMTKIWLRWESADTCVSARRWTGLENGTTWDDRNTNKLSRWLNFKMLQKWPY